MKFVSTLTGLLRESRRFGALRSSSWVQIFHTLLILYVKSKFKSRKTTPVSHRLAGFRIVASDYPTLITLYKEIFLDEVYRFSARNERPLIIDCGANIGVSVLYFKLLYPESEIMAFEPNPTAYALLEENIGINQLKRVSLFNHALSDVEGPVDFYVPDQIASLNASSKPNREEARIKVAGRRLSGLLSGKKPDFIKIDVEGDERKIIKDLKEHHLLKSVGQLAVEFHPREEKESGELEDFLAYFEPGFEYEERFVSEEVRSKNKLLYFKNRAL